MGAERVLVMIAQRHQQKNADQKNDDDDADCCSGEELETKMQLTKKPVGTVAGDSSFDGRSEFPTRTDPIFRNVSFSFPPRLAANAAKSWVATEFPSAALKRSRSSGDGMCHARSTSSGGKIGPVQIR